MNETVNKFLVVGDIFIPEMHLKQPEFACSVNHLLKTKKENRRCKIYSSKPTK